MDSLNTPSLRELALVCLHPVDSSDADFYGVLSGASERRLLDVVGYSRVVLDGLLPLEGVAEVDLLHEKLHSEHVPYEVVGLNH